MKFIFEQWFYHDPNLGAWPTPRMDNKVSFLKWKKAWSNIVWDQAKQNIETWSECKNV